ncbi:MAG: hypothetical protein [Hatfieldvirus porci]|uniref:Uncharacterized protein n=1 Tax=phage Lak_Megaphage_RVC_JS4_GC31 TaxID=3109228 RepID=A0ABZ0Z0Y4_9CAUD|nr:MAG: hypothetical protein [phage Lak_Megaphage_RVC_AP3_GC31]WQJ52852.1 MAG: hypothetical protein [phage Lak_Megaphage_RVC_JS4_GC31]
MRWIYTIYNNETQTITQELYITNMNIIDYLYHIIQAIFGPNSLVERWDYDMLIDRITTLNQECSDKDSRLHTKDLLLENYVKDYKELETSYDKLVIEHADEVEENTALRRKLERYYKTGKNS